MIQLLGIRPYVDEKGRTQRSDKFYEKNWTAPSVRELFADLPKYVAQIPENERWNMYYTALNCGPGKRVFASQDVIPFDIDDIAIPEAPDDLAPQLKKYVDIFCSTLGLDPQKIAAIFSGNGLQFLIHLESKLVDIKFFDIHRDHYKHLCSKLEKALRDAGLAGKLDPSVFSAARLLRLPLTTNRKPGKPERQAFAISWNLEPVPFDLVALSGIPALAPEDSLDSETLKQYADPDVEAIFKDCEFLKWCESNPQEPDEPHLYAALSIIGRLPDAEQHALRVFSGRFGKRQHGGCQEDLLAKMEQASTKSGPRTCANIDSIWGGCKTCVQFQKCKSPISITGETHIPTEKTGFYAVFSTKTGEVKKPAYEDLRRFFKRSTNYKNLGASNICYVWNGTHYEEYEIAYLNKYAQDHFDPKPDSFMVQEFTRLIQRTELVKPDWFQTTTRRKINFRNGVLDIDTMEFSPVHSPELGFRSVLPYDYNPHAACPAFDKFLEDITQNDPALQAILMEYLGYALSNDECWAEQCLVMEGEGSNGKSTFIDIVRAIAGDGNFTSISIEDLSNDYKVQTLDGKLFNIFEEVPTKNLVDSHKFKNFVTGGMVQVRQIYKKPYEMRCRAKIMFSCNALPHTKDHSDAYFRRLLIVPFRATFTDGNKDPFMRGKLLQELSGIFNKVILGYQRLWKQKKFTASDLVKERKESYRRQIDDAYNWILDNVEVKPLEGEIKETPFHTLYAAYCGDMERDNLGIESAKAFAKKLERQAPDYRVRRYVKKVSGKATVVIKNIFLNSTAAEEF
jgi:P4 family phage/plasmid primase-like protien